jgi:transcriptional regulator with XRE-family HTH domain
MSIGERIAQLRNERGLRQPDLAKKLNIGTSTLGMWETNKRKPNPEAITQLAEYFDVSTDYLLGVTNKRHYYELTSKDKQEIETQIQNMISGMDSDESLSFFKDGPELTAEDKRLLQASLRQTLTLSKELAKKKFTPKKYRKDVTPEGRNDGDQS